MKNLDLNQYGVQEMNAEEMKATNGGFFPIMLFAFIAMAGIITAFLIEDKII